MPKENEHVYSGNPMYNPNGYYGLNPASVVGYTPAGQTYYHTSDGQIHYNPGGGKSRSNKRGRRGHKKSNRRKSRSRR